MANRIIVNCDMGEGVGNDAELMPCIDACSIACGGHVGDQYSIYKTIRLAQEYNVAIGAHPSYPDPEGFGRKSMRLNDVNVQSSINKQLDLFFNQAEKTNTSVFHIKPHGALYNDIYSDEINFEIFQELISNYPFQYLFVLGGVKTKRSQSVLFEAFADRRYTSALRLLPRSRKDAVIHDIRAFEKHNLGLIRDNKVCCIDQVDRHVDFDTLCLHGDHPMVLEYAMNLKTLLNG